MYRHWNVLFYFGSKSIITGDEPTVFLRSSMIFSRGEEVGSTVAAIDFCPFCGQRILLGDTNRQKEGA
jgi:hypothetical protein